jgi:Tol biopolymer transport system component
MLNGRLALWRGEGLALLCMVLLAGCGQPHADLRVGEPLGQNLALAFTYMSLSRMPELYLLDDSQGLRRVSGDGVAATPAWSPDGMQLIYAVQQGNSYEYWLVEAAGTQARRLGVEASYLGAPLWSPDGRYLAYWAMRSSELVQAEVLALATGDVTVLSLEAVQQFAWLPGGMKGAGPRLLLLAGSEALTWSIYEGETGQIQQVAGAGYLQGAMVVAISPDGRRVAYTLARAEDDISLNDPLYVAALDGSDAQPVGELWLDGAAVWSPDGTRLAFVALANNTTNALNVVNADGTGLRQLSLLDEGDLSGEVLPSAPAWSPDGRQIAIGSFVSAQGSAILVLDAAGAGVRQVATANGLFYDLTWRPRN